MTKQRSKEEIVSGFLQTTSCRTNTADMALILRWGFEFIIEVLCDIRDNFKEKSNENNKSMGKKE